MWNKIVIWIKEHLKYISIFRIVFYVSTFIILLNIIIYGNLFNLTNMNKMKELPKSIFVLSLVYFNMYLVLNFIDFSVNILGNFFTRIGNSFSETYEDINNSKDENKSDKNTVLLRTIKYLLFLITIILSIILWKIW